MLDFLLPYWRLMRFDKPIGIYLLLWPCLWGLWIAAGGMPDFTILFIFIAGVVITRAAGCVINDIADRKFDLWVKRTRQRPLAVGQISLGSALLLFVGLLLIGLLLVLQLNLLSFWFAILAASMMVLYPFCKRFTYLPQCVLGLSFGCSVPMAFAAQLDHVPGVGWYLYAVAAIWTVMFDTIYAMVDRDDDLRIGIKSTAILFADHDRLLIGLMQICIVLGLAGLGLYLHLDNIYYVALGLGAGLFVYQQYLLKDRLPGACFRAFLNNHWFGMLIFLGIFLG